MGKNINIGHFGQHIKMGNFGQTYKNCSFWANISKHTDIVHFGQQTLCYFTFWAIHIVIGLLGKHNRNVIFGKHYHGPFVELTLKLVILGNTNYTWSFKGITIFNW